jgi:H+/Cl- antiporter ClcA
MHRRVAFVGIVLGLVMFAYGAFLDPFALPFQDFESLPQEVKDQYHLEARHMLVFSCLGVALMFLCVVAFFYIRRRQTPNNSLQGRRP